MLRQESAEAVSRMYIACTEIKDNKIAINSALAFAEGLARGLEIAKKQTDRNMIDEVAKILQEKEME